VHCVLGVNPPLAGETLNVTVPVGVVGPTFVLSVTVALQLVPLLTGIEAGVQLTEVVVARGAVTVRLVVPELVVWLASPP
jgi:hypothetical protein